MTASFGVGSLCTAVRIYEFGVVCAPLSVSTNLVIFSNEAEISRTKSHDALVRKLKLPNSRVAY